MLRQLQPVFSFVALLAVVASPGHAQEPAEQTPTPAQTMSALRAAAQAGDDERMVLCHWHLLTSVERDPGDETAAELVEGSDLRKAFRKMPRFWRKYVKAREQLVAFLSPDSPPQGIGLPLLMTWRDFLVQSPHAAHSIPDFYGAKEVGIDRLQVALTQVAQTQLANAEGSRAAEREALWVVRARVGEVPSPAIRAALWRQVRTQLVEALGGDDGSLERLERLATSLLDGCEDAMDDGMLELAWAMLAEAEVLDPIAAADFRVRLRQVTEAQVPDSHREPGRPGEPSALTLQIARQKNRMWNHDAWQLRGESIYSIGDATASQGMRTGITLLPGLVLTARVHSWKDREVGVVFGDPEEAEALYLACWNEGGQFAHLSALKTGLPTMEMLGSSRGHLIPGTPSQLMVQGAPFGARLAMDRLPWFQHRSVQLGWRGLELVLVAGLHRDSVANNAIGYRDIRLIVPEAWHRR